MECNRQEAFAAKIMAEKKLAERDVVGAKRLALKALNLCPDLDGLSQFLATLDVYVSSEERTNGEVNWYRVLGITPSADDDTIRRHYRKLALNLHPDKNKSVGAEGAFKIVSEAWGCLSDRARRSAYDRKRNAYHMYQNVQTCGSSFATGHNGFHDFCKDENTNSTTQMRAVRPKPPPRPHFSKANTFWTLCNFCRTQFEYLRFYVNTNLLCQNCRQPFFAVEMPTPPINGNGLPTTWPTFMQGQNSMQHERSNYSYATGAKLTSQSNVRPESNLGAFCKEDTAGRVSWGAPKSDVRKESIERIVHGLKEPGAGSGTGSTHAGLGPMPAGDRLKKNRRIIEHMRNDPQFQMPSRSGGCGDSGARKGNFETGNRHFFGRINQLRELSQQELQNMLVEKAKKDIQTNLRSCTSEKMEKEKGKQKVSPYGMKENGNSPEVVDTKSGAQSESFVAKLEDNPERKGLDPVSMAVPDPDFHDFDNDRTERSFGPNQVWAAYDNDDGMPRYYAMIHSVMSSKPLRMRISWLNSKNNRELAPINWIGSGFFKTSGIFWIGKHEIDNSLNSFSHKVKWAKGTRGTVQIYPSKGDVWAMYSNWSPGWNALTPDEQIHKYSMVEVLEDYNEEKGVSVAPLIKVAGYKTVFCRHPDSIATLVIPKEELFRLSHQVPSYMLMGKEGRNVPIGCLELDPASMPLELLQVFTKVQVKEMAENAVKTNILPRNGEKSEIQMTEDRETANERGAMETTTAERTEAEVEKLIVYKRKRGQNYVS